MATFHLIEDPKLLLKILEDRLPFSCFVYNQAKFSHKFPEHINFYVLSDEIDESTWIVTVQAREDYKHDICVSAPLSILKGGQIPPSIRECFASTPALNWDDEMVFVDVEKPVSKMLIDISANVKGNVTAIHPEYLFVMEKADALNLPTNPGPDATISSLDPEKGTAYITSTWAYAREGSRPVVSRWIAANPSCGIFVNGEQATSAVVGGSGQIYALHTKKKFRGKGYAKLTMNYVLKEMAKNELIPCSTVEVKNNRSVSFHRTLGAKQVAIVDYLMVKKLNID